ncbi:metal-dependent hydrolase [Halococcus hamelinensis]|uniref:Membrane-bound metal-dependent hydrolase n=1 Tax=Halococcus hamelinensis 100A6 TaxID=1132509 RepID=M0LWL6_9EURY|nr:metal-dependent hydrolase [Halococcus hamelinensis]EMA36759.1 membrane-bound metal-dependent hydrolase [Halococcus hamelinensis 100A6]
MWPWGHLAVGYLVYTGLARRRTDRPPTGEAALAAVFGTQFPDLVDKPLAWSFGVLPSGRSLAHSSLTALVVCGLVWLVARRRDRSRLAVAFAVGYATHLATDAIAPLLAGDLRDLAYLGWPLLPLPTPEPGIGFLERFATMELTAYAWFQFALVVLALAVWVRDGRPGLGTLRKWLGSWRRAVES